MHMFTLLYLLSKLNTKYIVWSVNIKTIYLEQVKIKIQLLLILQIRHISKITR